MDLERKQRKKEDLKVANRMLLIMKHINFSPEIAELLLESCPSFSPKSSSYRNAIPNVKTETHFEHIDIIHYRNGAVNIVLNRPKALNALTFEMLEQLRVKLEEFDDDSNVHIIVITGNGRAFCSGGDLKECNSLERGCRFAKKEYLLDCFIHRYRKPYISLLNGIMMGGGCGISVNGRYRVVTEKTIFSMPECSIGLFTDVGASHFFNQCPGKIGLFLALTGLEIGGSDAIYAKIGTHYVPSDDLEELKRTLFSDDLLEGHRSVESILERFSKETGTESVLARHRIEIDECFGAECVEAIISRLEKLETKWSNDVLATLHKQCPTSLKVFNAF